MVYETIAQNEPTYADTVEPLTAGRRTWLDLISSYLTFVLLLVFLVVAGQLSPAFLSVDNLISVAYGSAIVGIIALGQTMLLITANFDLSVGGVLGVTGVLTLLVLPHVGVAAAMAIGLAAGLGIGVINGLTVVLTRASPFLVTLGTMQLTYGIALAITNSRTLYGDIESFNQLGRAKLGMFHVALLLFIGLAVILQLVLSRTNIGRQLFAIGLNPSTARLSGIPVDRVVVSLFALSGLLAALGGITMASRLNSITADAGLGYEFLTVTAAVVGGTSLFGGRGGTLRTIVGILVIGALDNVLILLGASFSAAAMVRGFVFLVVVGIDGLARRGRRL